MGHQKQQSQGQELSKPSAKEGGKVYTPYQLSPGLHDSTAECDPGQGMRWETEMHRSATRICCAGEAVDGAGHGVPQRDASNDRHLLLPGYGMLSTRLTVLHGIPGPCLKAGSPAPNQCPATHPTHGADEHTGRCRSRCTGSPNAWRSAARCRPLVAAAGSAPVRGASGLGAGSSAAGADSAHPSSAARDLQAVSRETACPSY